MNKWLDYLWLNRFQWYRKWRKGTWYKHQFTVDAQQISLTFIGTWWARYGYLNRYSIVIDNETYGGHIVNTNEMVDQVPDVRKMVEDDVAPIDWLINQLENHIVLSAHNKLGTNRTGDYRIGLRKAIDFCHQAKEMESKETLYTEEQVRDAIDMARSQSGYASYEFKENEIIQSLKQHKQ